MAAGPDARTGFETPERGRRKMTGKKRKVILPVTAALLAAGIAALGVVGAKTPGASAPAKAPKPASGSTAITRIVKTNAEWKRILPRETYHVMREKGTEIAFTGRYWNNRKAGVYLCAACDLELFDSRQKYESGTGWPSFWDTPFPTHLEREGDSRLAMERTEILCARCGGHLGHVFDDGPKPTGLRYCMNSAALKFAPRKGAPERRP
jgi:peptide-methionine (R)-S-oxide reductase